MQDRFTRKIYIISEINNLYLYIARIINVKSLFIIVSQDLIIIIKLFTLISCVMHKVELIFYLIHDLHLSNISKVILLHHFALFLIIEKFKVTYYK